MASPADAKLIDQFNATQSVSVSGAPPASASNSATGAMVGGIRDVNLTLLQNPIFDQLTLTVNSGGNNILNMAQGPGVLGTSLLTWDGTAGGPLNPTGLGNTDFTDGGVQDRFAINVILAEGPIGLTITAYDFNTSIGYSQTVNTPIVTFGSPINLYFPFSGFGGSPPSDLFEHVGAVTLNIVPSATNLDFAADFFVTTVPEPGSMAMIGAGLATVGVAGAMRRRLRRQKT